ncbi:MAG: tetratricopeptide repeat protein, partial [Pseudomonadota bacterium]
MNKTRQQFLSLIAVLVSFAISVLFVWWFFNATPPSTLDAIQKAEKISDLVQRCVKYPQPTGIDWPKAAIEAFCADEFAVLPDYDTVIAWIESGETARADALYSRLVENYFDGDFPEGALWKIYGFFKSSDEQTARITRRWIEESPTSPHALIARGAYHLDAARDARGWEVVADTPSQNMSAMAEQADLAIKHIQRGLKRDGKIMPGYAFLIDIGRFIGNRALMQEAFYDALQEDPSTFYVRQQMSDAMMRRWGGSFAEQEQIFKEAEAFLDQNPRLINLGANADVFRALDLYMYEDGPPEDEYVMPIFEQAVAHGPHYTSLYNAGTTARDLGDDLRAVEMYTQILRFSPDHNSVRTNRAAALQALGETDWSIREYQIVLTNDPVKRSALTGLAWIKMGQKDWDAAIPLLERVRVAYPGEVGWSHRQLAWIYLYRTRDFDAAGPIIDEWLEQEPESGAAWLKRVDWLQNTNGPDLIPSIEQFIEYADLNDEDQQIAYEKA